MADENFLERNDMEGPLSGEVVLYSPAKLANKPWLVIALPCGNKRVGTKMVCPKEVGGCGLEFVSMGNMFPHLVPLRFMVAFTNMARPLNVASMFLWDAGRPSAEARQRMTDRAKKIGAKYILYIDDDTIMDPKGLHRMFNYIGKHPEIGAISGVVSTREDPTEPTVYKHHGEGVYWDLEIGPKAEPEPVFGTGAAFLLARIDAIKDVEAKLKEEYGQDVPIWSDETIYKKDGKHTIELGHDVRFCYLLNKYGWPVYADGRVVCGHLDTMTDTIYSVPEDYPGILRYKRRMGEIPDAKQEQETEEVHDCCLQESEVCEESGDQPGCCVRVPSGRQSESCETSEEKPLVEIIVVCHNQPHYEGITIDRVRDCTRDYPYILNVINNNAGENLHAVWNNAIAESKAKYICLLNSDTAVTPGWLNGLMKTLLSDKKFGAVVPSSNRVHLSQIPAPFPDECEDFELINRFAMKNSCENSGKVQGLKTLSAMCVVFSKWAWEKLSGFDERFFLYGGDTEFFNRMHRLLDFNLVWVKDVYIHHYKARSVKAAVERGELDYNAERRRAVELCRELIPDYEDVIRG